MEFTDVADWKANTAQIRKKNRGKICTEFSGSIGLRHRPYRPMSSVAAKIIIQSCVLSKTILFSRQYKKSLNKRYAYIKPKLDLSSNIHG